MKVLNLVTTKDSAHYQEQLRSLDIQDIEYDVVASQDCGLNEDSKALSMIPSPLDESIYFGASSLEFYPRVLRHALNSDEYDLVHATSGLVAPFAFVQPIRPIVVTLWGSDLMGDYMGGYFDPLCRLCAKKADETIVMTNQMNDELEQDAHVIPDGIDLEKFRPEPQEKSKMELGWDPDKYHVLFPYSRERKVKQYPIAKEIVDEVDNQIKRSVELVTVSGEPHSKIPTYMNAADALILTSKHEGSPNTVKEAMACNLPVASLNVGDVADRLEGVEPSFVENTKADLREGLIKILRENKRSNGRDHVQDLSLPHRAKKIHEIYNLALKNE